MAAPAPERVQRAVTFGPSERQKTQGSQRPGKSSRAQRPKTSGLDLASLVAQGDVLPAPPPEYVRKTRPKSMYEINKEKRDRKKALNEEIQRQTSIPISKEKLRRMRTHLPRPVEITQEQRREINERSYAAVMDNFRSLREAEDRRAQGHVSASGQDSIQAMQRLKELSERVHANIEAMRSNTMLKEAQLKEKRRMAEQSRNAMMLIYQEEEISLEQLQSKTKTERRRKLIKRLHKIVANVAERYRARLLQMEAREMEKYSASSRLVKQKKSAAKQFNSLFEAIQFMGFGDTPEARAQQKVWQDVRECRYLRGHVPEKERMPDDDKLTDFVFGRSPDPAKSPVPVRAPSQASAAKSPVPGRTPSRASAAKSPVPGRAPSQARY